MRRMAFLVALCPCSGHLSLLGRDWLRPMHLVHCVNLVFKDASVICIETLLQNQDHILLLVVLFADQTRERG